MLRFGSLLPFIMCVGVLGFPVPVTVCVGVLKSRIATPPLFAPAMADFIFTVYAIDGTLLRSTADPTETVRGLKESLKPLGEFQEYNLVVRDRKLQDSEVLVDIVSAASARTAPGPGRGVKRALQGPSGRPYVCSAQATSGYSPTLLSAALRKIADGFFTHAFMDKAMRATRILSAMGPDAEPSLGVIKDAFHRTRKSFRLHEALAEAMGFVCATPRLCVDDLLPEIQTAPYPEGVQGSAATVAVALARICVRHRDAASAMGIDTHIIVRVEKELSGFLNRCCTAQHRHRSTIVSQAVGAAKALGMLEDPASVDALTACAGHPDLTVRTAGQRALGKLRST